MEWRREMIRNFPCYPQPQSLPAGTACFSFDAPPELALSTQLGRSRPLTCCSDTRASHWPQPQKLWREAWSRKRVGGFEDRGCRGEWRDAAGPALAVGGSRNGQHPRTEELRPSTWSECSECKMAQPWSLLPGWLRKADEWK